MLKYFSALLFVGVLVGCAKEKPYDEVNRVESLEFKDQHMAKDTIQKMCGDRNDPCLYLPSVANTPYKVSASRPYWQGEQKVVISKITQDKLQFLEVGTQENFDDNINNLTPVLSFGVDHIDYRCVEDDYGDCTNKEEVDSDKPWEKRKYIKLNLSAFAVQEVNSLPIQYGELFAQGCFQKTGEDVSLFDVTENSMNMTVKATYKASSINCANYIQEWEDIRYLTFNIDYKYSIAKLSSLTDPKYKKVEYGVKDQAYFGFFKTDYKESLSDHQDNVMGIRKSLLNRWSPNKKEVVYYLNSAFYTDEMKDIKNATVNAIETVNMSLKMANTNLSIKLKKGNDKEIGDLDKNFIILVPEPQASGVIGYGPSVADPNTGEIINARTVMYYGTIQKYVGRSWDEIVDADTASRTENTEDLVVLSSQSESSNQLLNMVESTEDKFLNLMLAKADFDRVSPEVVFNSDRHLYDILQEDGLEFSEFFRRDPVKNFMKEAKTQDSKLAHLSKNTFFHASFMNFDDAVKSVIEEQRISQDRKLPYWSELTEEQRKGIMKNLLPMVWVPTLVHEFGHNLGLRHNFYGSTDKANFFTKEEAQSIGMSNIPQYSSIMDYAYRSTNELSIMGKYDVAALRFGYARAVETKDKKLAAIPAGITDEVVQVMKPFRYCTDEHVSNDLMCNRHDEGTSRQEIVEHYIDSYKKYYDKRNFRGRKYNMNSRYEDFDYLVGVFNRFLNIRTFFDQYDQRAYTGTYDGEEWKKNPTLVDIKNASKKSFDFFLSVLEEPGYHCIEIDKESKQITRVAPFSEMALGTQLEDFGITFDIRFGCLYLNHYGDKSKIYAEFGKYINNSLDLSVPRDQIVRTDTSQIDIRGVWMDKTLAGYALSLRIKQPTTIGAASAGNYLDYEEYRSDFEKYMNGLMKNKYNKEVVASFINGAKAKVKVDYSFDQSYQVNQSYNYGVNYLMGLADSRTSLKKVMMRWFKRGLTSGSDGSLDIDDSLYDQFNVTRLKTTVPIEHFSFDRYAQFYKKGDDATILYRFGMKKDNIEAMKLTDTLEKVQFLDKQKTEDIDMAIAALNNDEEVMDASVLKITEVGLETLMDYKTGILSQQSILSSFMALNQDGLF